ncbi:MAG: dTMP kinase [Proteobacteria bacterium]|nr:dTMP kinase [Pseudomonadota bacterium]
MTAPKRRGAATRRARRGHFITIEGGEGAGKTTQILRLAAALRGIDIDVVTTREPGGAPSAERIRTLLVEGDPGTWQPKTEALLHFAARTEHLHHVIRPALQRGAWVISDRFADSTMAYQGYGHRLGRDIVAALYRLVVGKFAPDLTLILDLPVAKGLARAAARLGKETRYERMQRAFHERLRRGFLDIARREKRRCVVIDAAQAADAVTTQILSTVSQRFGVRL